ncbi:hypothetical protein Tco_0453252 [Tanacetum coccineum]
MKPDISKMTLNEYLMYEDMHRSYIPRKSVAPVRNRILVYRDLDEEDEDHNEVDIDNMTLEEYARYEVAMSSKKGETINTPHGFTFQFFNQSQHTPNPLLDEKDSSLNEILDDLFRIGAENVRKIEHEVPHRCDDKTVDITKDNDQEDGELPDLPTFFAPNEFASVCKQVEENIDVNTAQELEEVQVGDVEMDEDDDIDHSNTEKTLQ